MQNSIDFILKKSLLQSYVEFTIAILLWLDSLDFKLLFIFFLFIIIHL